MAMICRTLLVAMLLTGIASSTTGQINRRVTTGADNRRAQKDPTTDRASDILELRCRGGGLQINITPGEMREADLWTNMTVHFTRAVNAAGVNGQSLAPGQCALPDRALLSSEPAEMRGEIIGFGQRDRKMHGDPIYNGDMGAERYPDAHNVPPYLGNPNHYWSFFAVNTLNGYFRFSNLHYWKPGSAPESSQGLQAPTSTGRLATPASGANNKLGSRTRLDPDPVPAHAVRIYVRYSTSYGYLANSTAFGKLGPYSCDAFTVDARMIAGVGSSKSVGGSIVNPAAMRTEGNDYVCGFTITDLPQNQAISVSATVDNKSSILIGPWLGEGQPRPPSGYERAILKGLQNIILTNQNPFEIVTFEMVYAPVSATPR